MEIKNIALFVLLTFCVFCQSMTMTLQEDRYKLYSPFADEEHIIFVANNMTDLHEAAKRGDVKHVQVLLSSGIDVTIRDESGCTALHLAAYEGYTEVVKVLLASISGFKKISFVDAVINNPENLQCGMTALHLAAKKGNINIVWTLLFAGADVSIVDVFGSTALHLAAKVGHVEVINALLDVIPSKQKATFVNIRDEFGCTALHWAVFWNNISAYNLIQAGADVNIKDVLGRTALCLAREAGNDKVIQLLITAGAQVTMELASYLQQFGIVVPVNRTVY